MVKAVVEESSRRDSRMCKGPEAGRGLPPPSMWLEHHGWRREKTEMKLET